MSLLCWILLACRTTSLADISSLNNLSIASRIYLLEPQWNPSVESQAIGRIFRLGQERPVTVIRYIMDKTIEEVGLDLTSWAIEATKSLVLECEEQATEKTWPRMWRVRRKRPRAKN
jgi:hypothetical protein